MRDNRADVVGSGEHLHDFIQLLNQRMDEYSECTYEKDGPGFSLKRVFGNHVRDVMGAKDNKWIPDYVMEIEVPKIIAGIKRVLSAMDETIENADFNPPPIPEGGAWGEG